MARILYSRPSDNVAGDATITASAEDADYPASYLVNLNPARPAKLTTTTGWWKFAYGAAQRVDVVAIIHHNLTAGLEVRIQSSALSDFSVLQVNTTITIPAAHEDNFSVNPWKDLTGVANYSASGHQYWRVLIVGTNAAAVAIGEVLLIETKRQPVVNVSWGAVEGEQHPLVEHRTDHGVSSIYDFGPKWRTYEGEVDTTDAGAAELVSLYRDARGRARGWLFVADADVNDAMFVRFKDTAFARGLTFLERNKIAFAVEEVSRGLYL